MLEPDIGQEPISPIEALDAELGQLAQMHSSAVKDGRRIDAALLEVKHAEKFAAWCAMQKASAVADIAALEASRSALTRRINWWRELSQLDGEPSQLSPAQKSIFEGSELLPRDWREAKRVLAILPEFEQPLKGNFHSWHASFMDIQAVTNVLLEHLQKAIIQFGITDARDPSWNLYRTETHPELGFLAKQLEEAWAAAEFSR